MYMVHPNSWATSTKWSHPVTIILFKVVTICNKVVASHRISLPKENYELITLNIIVQYEFIKLTCIISLVNNFWHLNLPMLSKTESNEWK